MLAATTSQDHPEMSQLRCQFTTIRTALIGLVINYYLMVRQVKGVLSRDCDYYRLSLPLNGLN